MPGENRKLIVESSGEVFQISGESLYCPFGGRPGEGRASCTVHCAWFNVKGLGQARCKDTPIGTMSEEK